MMWSIPLLKNAKVRWPRRILRKIVVRPFKLTHIILFYRSTKVSAYFLFNRVINNLYFSAYRLYIDDQKRAVYNREMDLHWSIRQIREKVGRLYDPSECLSIEKVMEIKKDLQDLESAALDQASLHRTPGKSTPEIAHHFLDIGDWTSRVMYNWSEREGAASIINNCVFHFAGYEDVDSVSNGRRALE